jgi:hypothetical protein
MPTYNKMVTMWGPPSLSVFSLFGVCNFKLENKRFILLIFSLKIVLDQHVEENGNRFVSLPQTPLI